MIEQVREFTVLDGNGKTSQARGYQQANQKAISALKDSDVAVIVIRITKGKAK